LQVGFIITQNRFRTNIITENKPMKRIATTSLVAFLVLTGLAAQAQKPLPPDPSEMIQRHVNMLTNKLGLSASQQEQATTIFTNAWTAQKSLHGQMRTAHETLQAAVSKNDAAGIEQAASNIGSLTAQSISTHAKAEAAFLQTLNGQQQATYSQMMQHHGRRGFAGHGGFGSGGPGGPQPF
jgi:Spy/CpxP family protein refolding chaperone